jgi:hypothetical protein
MPPITFPGWLRPVLALTLCLSAVALIWYGLSELFDHDPSATGSLVEQY